MEKSVENEQCDVIYDKRIANDDILKSRSQGQKPRKVLPRIQKNVSSLIIGSRITWKSMLIVRYRPTQHKPLDDHVTPVMYFALPESGPVKLD